MIDLFIVDALWRIGAFCSLIAAIVLLLQLALEDLKSRLVSAGKCYAFVAACFFFQFCANGTSQIGLGLTWSVIVLIACWFANAVQSRRYRCRAALCVSMKANDNVRGRYEDEIAIGSGDVVCMVGLCLASGQAILPGVLCFFVVVGAFSIAGVVGGRLSATDAIPLIPFFFAWLVPVSVAVL